MTDRAFDTARTGSSDSVLFFLYALPINIFNNDRFKSVAHSPASPEPELPLDCGV